MGFQRTVNLAEDQSVESMDSGGKLSTGWYRTKLTDHYEDNTKPGQYVFEFTVDAGPFRGEKAWYRFDDPDTVEEEDKRKTAEKRIKMLGCRFGQIKPGDEGRSDVNLDFGAALDREFVIQIEEWKQTDPSTKEVTKRGTQIAWAGIYPLDHEKIPDNVRAELKLPPARAKGSDAAAGTTAAAPAPPPAAGGGASRSTRARDLIANM